MSGYTTSPRHLAHNPFPRLWTAFVGFVLLTVVALTLSVGEWQRPIVGMLVAAFQAASQVQDAAMSHAPRMLAVTLALLVVGPWMGREIASFATQMFQLAAL